MAEWPVRCFLSEEMRTVVKENQLTIVSDGAKILLRNVLRDLSLENLFEKITLLVSNETNVPERSIK